MLNGDYRAGGPAHVSTQCDELMEALNELRISLMSTEADAQISLLEKALINLNRRQVTALAFCQLAVAGLYFASINETDPCCLLRLSMSGAGLLGGGDDY